MEADRTFAGLKKNSRDLAAKCSALPRFADPVKAVYNPLDYASGPHNLYLKLTCGVSDKPAGILDNAHAGIATESQQKKAIFLGMNPGPWGMSQTGVPFGEIASVRDWLGIEVKVDKPEHEHPKRPIEGFACARSEVSGRRLWGLFRERFGAPEVFFREHFVANYCPLVFMNESGANITPDKLPADERDPLFEICDSALAELITLLKPEWVIGIGGFAKKRIDIVEARFFDKEKSPGKTQYNFKSAQILHPSPASPKANAGWDREVTKTLEELGVWS